jgi:hypothetical protein
MLLSKGFSVFPGEWGNTREMFDWNLLSPASFKSVTSVSCKSDRSF